MRLGERYADVLATHRALLRAAFAAHEGFRFHDLRHTFASHFVMRGGSLQDLRKILGHADFKMTLRYAHLSTKHLRASIKRMEGLTSAHRSAQSAKIGSDRRVS